MSSSHTKPPKAYPPILPTRSEWPVVQLSKNRKEFVNTVIEETLNKLLKNGLGDQRLVEELEMTLYLENNRIRRNPWKVDPEDEQEFWADIKTQLLNLNPISDEKGNEEIAKMVESIVTRYAEEIAGNFKQSSYRMARTIITFGFARLLNAARIKGPRALFSGQLDLQDKIQVNGEIEQLRSLAKIGTVVMVPTHFSNLDSALIGWVIQYLGLPAFIYGAGLNLFNIGIFAYFMNSLGAYKVDRRKKNLVYLETLKTYSTEALKYGCHSLFFPGGTRSRSGRIEEKLKLGLLSTTIEAQRCNYLNHPPEKATKIFVVPVVLNYHFVLEAPSLIHQFLQQQGQERYYVESDEQINSYKILKFLVKFFTEGSDISVNIGKALDAVGNYVDQEGNSIDLKHRPIDTSDYFKSFGEISKDPQRDMEYTNMLAERITGEYHRINRVFSSHLVAFVAFRMLRQRYAKLDIFDFLRLPPEDMWLDYRSFSEQFHLVREKIFELRAKGALQTALHLEGPLEEVISHGLNNVGLYHANRPLIADKAGNIVSQDLFTLYYYHNRMHGYGLEQLI
jgi:glycerol-3-phosphate O-acyltransferase